MPLSPRFAPMRFFGPAFITRSPAPIPTPIPALILALGLALGLAACSETPPVGAPQPLSIDTALVTDQSARVAGQFTAALQARLGAAMQAGGPLQAMDVCYEEAPEIAAHFSAESGALLRRVAARNRNPDGTLASADPALAEYYAELEAAPMAGDSPAARIWQSGTGADARVNFLSAIPMREQPCAACHGNDIAPEVAQRISELYPHDTATGFAAGDLRGAMLVSWPAEAFAQ